MDVLHTVKAILCDVNGTMFSLAPLGERMQQVGLQGTDLQVIWLGDALRLFVLRLMTV